MTQWTVTLFLTAVFASTVAHGQTDTSEWKDIMGRQLIYCKGHSFNSTLIVLDSLSKDTLEIDRQISQNHCLSVLYENNKPKYKIFCKAYYDKKAKQTKKEERHHNFHMWLSAKHIKRYGNFFPVFYYGKSAKIKQKEIFTNNKWKKCKDKNIKPLYALFENYIVNGDGKTNAKF